MKKLLHLYNYGHNPFPKLGRGGLGYHLPQYKIKGGKITIGEDGLINDDGDDENPFFIQNDQIEGIYSRDDEGRVTVTGFDPSGDEPTFQYSIGKTKKNVESIEPSDPELKGVYNLFNRHEDEDEDEYDPNKYTDADKFDIDEYEARVKKAHDKLYNDEKSTIENYNKNYNGKNDDDIIDDVISKLLDRYVTIDSFGREIYTDVEILKIINKLTDPDIYKKDGSVKQTKFSNDKDVTFNLIEYIKSCNTKEKVNHLLDRLCTDYFGIDVNELYDENEESEPIDKEYMKLFEPLETDYLTEKEIKKIRSTKKLEPDEEDDEDTVSVFSQLNEKNPFKILLNTDDIDHYDIDDIKDLLYSQLIVDAEGGGKDLEAMIFNNKELLKQIIKTSIEKLVTDVNITQSTKRNDIADGRGTVTIDGVEVDIEVECKKFILSNYKAFNSIEKLINTFKNEFNYWYYNTIITPMYELNIASISNPNALKKRNEFLKSISKNGKIDPERLDLKFLQYKTYPYAPVTQTKFPKIPTNVIKTNINPDTGIQKLLNKQVKSSSKNKSSTHDEYVVLGLRDGILTGNITKKINRMIEVYCEVNNIPLTEKNKVHALTILKLVHTPYSGHEYDNIGVPFHWLSSVNLDNSTKHEFTKEQINEFKRKAKINIDKRNESKEIRNAIKNAKKTINKK
jgi:hypothetical protein